MANPHDYPQNYQLCLNIIMKQNRKSNASLSEAFKQMYSIPSDDNWLSKTAIEQFFARLMINQLIFSQYNARVLQAQLLPAKTFDSLKLSSLFSPSFSHYEFLRCTVHNIKNSAFSALSKITLLSVNLIVYIQLNIEREPFSAVITSSQKVNTDCLIIAL